MAWVSVHQQIRDHRKTRELFRTLKISRAEAVGTLTLIWTWAIDNCDTNGRLLAATKQDIADAAYWTRDAEELYKALVDTHWLDEIEGGIFLHDWYDFNKPFYDYLERKEKDKIRKRNGKSKGQSTGQSSGNSEEIPAETPQEFHDSHSPAPSPIILYSINNKGEDGVRPVDNVDNSEERELMEIDGVMVDVTGLSTTEKLQLKYKKMADAINGL